jgi:hypothetical protein
MRWELHAGLGSTCGNYKFASRVHTQNKLADHFSNSRFEKIRQFVVQKSRSFEAIADGSCSFLPKQNTDKSPTSSSVEENKYLNLWISGNIQQFSVSNEIKPETFICNRTMVLKTNRLEPRLVFGMGLRVLPALKKSTRGKNRSARGSEECERATHRALTAGQRRGGPCWTSRRAGQQLGTGGSSQAYGQATYGGISPLFYPFFKNFCEMHPVNFFKIWYFESC